MDSNTFITNKLKDLQKPFYLCVSGNSMAPKINSGDRILVMPIIKKPLNIGDIIVYHKFQEHLTVHRILNIVKLSETRFYCETKGDNNLEIDPYKVLSHESIGVVDYERTNENELD